MEGLTKTEIYQSLETITHLVLALKAERTPAQTETFAVLEAHLARLQGELYQDIAQNR